MHLIAYYALKVRDMLKAVYNREMLKVGHEGREQKEEYGLNIGDVEGGRQRKEGKGGKWLNIGRC